MEIKITDNILDAEVLINNQKAYEGPIIIFQQSPKQPSVVFATRKWAELHRDALKQLPGYITDFALHSPNQPAQISFSSSATDVETMIKNFI